MLHLSRLAEEITWWSNPRFGFVRAADSFTTGSSMMPNKRNPDPAELVRGRAARVVGSLAGFLALLKGLPLAYQRDLQEDKPPLFEACATFEASLGVMAGWSGRWPWTAMRCGGRPPRASRRRPRSRTRSSGAASPSARRTTWWDVSSAPRRRPGSRSPILATR